MNDGKICYFAQRAWLTKASQVSERGGLVDLGRPTATLRAQKATAVVCPGSVHKLARRRCFGRRGVRR